MRHFMERRKNLNYYKYVYRENIEILCNYYDLIVELILVFSKNFINQKKQLSKTKNQNNNFEEPKFVQKEVGKLLLI
jgi:hypothetical protein